MVILGIFLIILQAMDILTTRIGLKNGCVEGNPLIKDKLSSGFPVYLIFIKITLSTLITFFLSLGIVILNWIFLAFDIFLLIVVLNNISGIIVQKKWNLKYNNTFGNREKFTQFLTVREWITVTHHKKNK